MNLIYLTPWPVGGFASFTNHMYHSLIAEGEDVNVLRCNLDKDEKSDREIKSQGIVYRNVSVKTAIKMTKKDLTLIAAVARPDDMRDPDTLIKLVKAGAVCRVASTQEFKQFPHLEYLKKTDQLVLCIRKSLLPFFKNAKYLPHPYVPTNNKHSRPDWDDRKRACQLAMVAHNKNPEMVCQANHKVERSLRIKQLGKETTPWIGMNLKKKYPWYEKPKGYKSSAEGVALASNYKLAIDLSVYPNEGGGTQFCFMEAIDAGCINVLHREWTKVKGDMIEDENCLAIGSRKELVRVLEGDKDKSLKRIYKNSLDILAAHSPHVVVRALRKAMS